MPDESAAAIDFKSEVTETLLELTPQEVVRVLDAVNNIQARVDNLKRIDDVLTDGRYSPEVIDEMKAMIATEKAAVIADRKQVK